MQNAEKSTSRDNFPAGRRNPWTCIIDVYTLRCCFRNVCGGNMLGVLYLIKRADPHSSPLSRAHRLTFFWASRLMHVKQLEPLDRMIMRLLCQEQLRPLPRSTVLDSGHVRRTDMGQETQAFIPWSFLKFLLLKLAFCLMKADADLMRAYAIRGRGFSERHVSEWGCLCQTRIIWVAKVFYVSTQQSCNLLSCTWHGCSVIFTANNSNHQKQPESIPVEIRRLYSHVL